MPNMPPKAGQLRTGLRSGGCLHVEKNKQVAAPKSRSVFFGNNLGTRVLGPPLYTAAITQRVIGGGNQVQLRFGSDSL